MAFTKLSLAPSNLDEDSKTRGRRPYWRHYWPSNQQPTMWINGGHIVLLGKRVYGIMFRSYTCTTKSPHLLYSVMCSVFVTQIGGKWHYSKVCVRDFSTVKIYWLSGRFVSNFKDSQRILTQDTKICACNFSTVKTYWHASRAHANFKDSQRFARRVNRVNNKGPQGAFKIHVCRVMYIIL